MRGAIFPNDYSHYEMLNEVVQQEPARSTDPELMGSIAAIGIVTPSRSIGRAIPNVPESWVIGGITAQFALRVAKSRVAATAIFANYLALVFCIDSPPIISHTAPRAPAPSSLSEGRDVPAT